ncbi:hypothetical protein [Mesorhizobium sp. AA22]|uniref:hypothetical protein n=1 Tax=Mesorhizobium sp. AA22 TaxID=1854057 RepID=UPI0012EAC1A5|nr:hypothetical protein [Mesorhizobium sp. AA22]QIA23386.1 hypothetical protein A9K68_017595 [Mesorhizobium sp. AA22]
MSAKNDRLFGAWCGESEIRITLGAAGSEFRIHHISNVLKIQCGGLNSGTLTPSIRRDFNSTTLVFQAVQEARKATCSGVPQQSSVASSSKADIGGTNAAVAG